MGKVVRVNLEENKITYETVPEKYKLLGGRALTASIISDEVPPEIDPLGKNNKIVFAPGVLGGTTASSAHRLSIGSKSPLTGGIKESNSGGNVALKIARNNIKAIIIEGFVKDGLKALKVDSKEVSLIEANSAKGKKATATAEWIKNKFGRKVAFSLIGPAGERGYLASAIVNSDKDGAANRFSARGGLGAVMGKKGLKALIVDDEETKKVNPFYPDEFKKAIKTYHKALRETPQTAQIYKKYGTTAMVDVTNEVGGMPTRNFSTGYFKKAGNINGKALREKIIARGGDPEHACVPGCLIKSSNIYMDKEGKPLVRSLEYETIILCGSNCDIDD